MSENIEDILLRDCKPYLDEIKYCFDKGVRKSLRRGTPIPIESFVKLKPRKDRKPMNTALELHNSADRWFEKNFGIKVRSSSVFCTSNKEQSSDYGTSYMVFPIGEYHTLFSPEIHDMYFTLTEKEIVRRIDPEYDEGLSKADAYKEAVKLLKTYPDEEIDKVVFDILDNAGYKKDDLVSALISKNEICLICESYYLVNPSDQDFIQFFHDYVLGIK